MNTIEAIQIIINEAEVSAIGESTEEHKIVLDACKKAQNWLNPYIKPDSTFMYIKNPKQ